MPSTRATLILSVVVSGAAAAAISGLIVMQLAQRTERVESDIASVSGQVRSIAEQIHDERPGPQVGLNQGWWCWALACARDQRACDADFASAEPYGPHPPASVADMIKCNQEQVAFCVVLSNGAISTQCRPALADCLRFAKEANAQGCVGVE